MELYAVAEVGFGVGDRGIGPGDGIFVLEIDEG